MQDDSLASPQAVPGRRARAGAGFVNFCSREASGDRAARPWAGSSPAPSALCPLPSALCPRLAEPGEFCACEQGLPPGSRPSRGRRRPIRALPRGLLAGALVLGHQKPGRLAHPPSRQVFRAASRGRSPGKTVRTDCVSSLSLPGPHSSASYQRVIGQRRGAWAGRRVTSAPSSRRFVPRERLGGGRESGCRTEGLPFPGAGHWDTRAWAGFWAARSGPPVSAADRSRLRAQEDTGAHGGGGPRTSWRWRVAPTERRMLRGKAHGLAGAAQWLSVDL